MLLKAYHTYRQLKKAFNGSQEHDTVPKSLTGEQVLERVDDLNIVFGKTQKKENVKLPYGRRGQYCLIFHIGLI